MSIKHLIFAAVSGTRTPTGYWMNSVPVPTYGSPTGVCADDSGNSYFAMWDDWNQTSVILKFDVNGQVLWQKNLPGVGINGLAKNGSAGIIACGVHYSGVSHYALLSISSIGALTWSYHYGTASQESGYLLNVAVAASGNIYACGFYYGTGVDNLRDGTVMKFSSTGTLTWQKHYTGTTKVDRAFSLALDSSENVWVIGEGGSQASGRMLLKFDSNGNSTLSRSVAGAECYGVDTDSSGNVYFHSERHAVCKMNSAGTKSWEKYQGIYNEWISTISVDPSNGDVYVLQDAVAEGDGYWLYKYNTSGTLIWFRSLGNSGYEQVTYSGRQMVVTSDSVFITLKHSGSGNAIFLKLRKDGTVIGDTPPLNYRASSATSGDGTLAMAAATFSIVTRSGIAAISYTQAVTVSSLAVSNTIL